VHPSSVFPLHAPGRAYVARRVPGARACSPHVTASRPWQILRMPHGGAGRGRPLLRATRFTRAPLCGRVTSRRSVTQRNARPVTASPLTSAAGPARRIPTAEPRSATSPPLAGKYRCTVHTWRAQLGLDFPLAHKKLQRTPSTSYPSGAHALWRRPGPSVSESGRHRGRCGWVLELFQSRVLSWWWAPREVAFRVSLPLLPRR
jgi:hypothetical protein